MRELIINENEAGQRFDKFLKKYMPEASTSFFYKMMRKKNIVLNGRKASGNEKLSAGDSVKLFFSEETIEKFVGKSSADTTEYPVSKDLVVIYEDANVLILNKPAGMLAQKAKKDDVSVVEYVIGYLLQTNALTKDELHTFHPAVCNRLDRNTSGLIVAGKSLVGLQYMSEAFKKRTLEKYYLCFVKGKISDASHIEGYLRRNEKTHKVQILKHPQEDAVRIETEYVPLAYTEELTLLKVHLITGRTHQIRAHLSSQGHPLLGDFKYGDEAWNRPFKKKFGITAQMLHAYELKFPQVAEPLQSLTNQTFCAPVPPDFYRLIKETSWQHGIHEALGVLH